MFYNSLTMQSGKIPIYANALIRYAIGNQRYKCKTFVKLYTEITKNIFGMFRSRCAWKLILKHKKIVKTLSITLCFNDFRYP